MSIRDKKIWKKEMERYTQEYCEQLQMALIKNFLFGRQSVHDQPGQNLARPQLNQ
jgi:hypothetical protein